MLKCDRCTQTKHDVVGVFVRLQQPRTNEADYTWSFELCSECYDAVKNFLHEKVNEFVKRNSFFKGTYSGEIERAPDGE